MRKTKIVCTIGPASEDIKVFSEMVKSGLNIVRLNFSHGTHEEHKKRIDMVKKVRETLGVPIPIMLDTKGPEIRTGNFLGGEAFLKEGQNVILTTREVLGNDSIFSVSYSGLPMDVKKEDRILIDDGNIGLKVLDILNDTDILCVVENSGIVKDKKGVNVPGVKINLPAITEKDIDDIMFGIREGIDFIAASFVRKASDVLAIRRILEEENAEYINIIAKIENQEGIDNLDEIIKVADGIMVARGDLGVEIPTEEVPIVQKMIIKKCNLSGKPVITATQMLDSMIRNPRPTRAEATDIANAILDGTDAIMLSGETAAGKYPVESVRTMAKIAETTEKTINYRDLLLKRATSSLPTITHAISHATCTIAQDLGASAIITATKSGYTARMVSKYRPQAPIVAVTTDERVQRKLMLLWGVYPLLTKSMDTTDDMIEESVNKALEAGYIRKGDLVVITAGIPVGITGTTNMVKVHIVGDVILKGIGIGNRAITGEVCIIKHPEREMDLFKEGAILVTEMTDTDFMPIIKKASAIVTEEGGLTSHAAIIGVELGIPVIVGAKGATEQLKNGMIVTMDTVRGLIYKGAAKII